MVQLLGIAGLWAGGTAFLRSRAPIGRDVSGNSNAQRILSDSGFPQSGPADSDLAIAVFSDYQCPACRFAEPGLIEAVDADRHIKIIYRDWPVFGPRSDNAARVALASAYQGKYEAVHRQLMTTPGRLDEARVRSAAEQSGVYWPRLQQDLEAHDDEIKRKLSKTAWDAFGLGLPGTPGYLIGNLLVTGALRESEFRRAFARARELAGAPKVSRSVQ